MSIRTVARFVLKALDASLLKEVTKHNREMGKALKTRDAKRAKLNADIKELADTEGSRIAAIMSEAESKVARIKDELHAKSAEKRILIQSCEQFCKHSQEKAAKAGAMRAKVLAITE